MYNCQNVAYTQCVPSTEDCGVNVVVASNVAITRVCNEITYTVTITNNSDQVMRNVVMTLPLNKALALMPNTVTVNGTTLENADLNNILIGDLPVGETATITYQTMVMECQRYIKTTAKVRFLVCCCFARKNLCVQSNVNCVQVCCCCQGTN